MKINQISKKELKNFCNDSNTVFVSAVLELTSKCNFHCVHCYQKISIADKSFNETKTLIDKLFELGVIFIVLTGGEAVLSKHFEETYLYLKKKGFLITLYSNGSNLSKYFSLLNNFKPLNISVSIYGLTEEKYQLFTGVKHQLEKIKNTLQFLVRNNINFELKTIVSKLNFLEVISEQYDDFASEYDTKMFYSYSIFATKLGGITPFDYSINEDEVVLFLDWQAKKGLHQYDYNLIIEKSPAPFLCTAGISSLHINCNYQISTCLKDSKYLFDYNLPTKILSSELKSRGRKIKMLAIQMNCSICRKNFRCEWCPIDFQYNNSVFYKTFRCNIQEKLIEKFTKV